MADLSQVKTSVTANVEEWASTFQAKVKQHVKEAAQPVVEEHLTNVANLARDKVPVKTGTLRDSIQTSVAPSGLKGVVKCSGKIAPHAHLVHFGTVCMEGRPFLYDAADALKSEFKDSLDQALNKG